MYKITYYVHIVTVTKKITNYTITEGYELSKNKISTWYTKIVILIFQLYFLFGKKRGPYY